MYKIWVDIDTGEWGWVNNLRTLDVQWWDVFEELIKDMAPSEIVQMAKALGKDMK